MSLSQGFVMFNRIKGEFNKIPFLLDIMQAYQQ